jgi:hypothetical protein
LQSLLKHFRGNVKIGAGKPEKWYRTPLYLRVRIRKIQVVEYPEDGR